MLDAAVLTGIALVILGFGDRRITIGSGIVLIIIGALGII